MYNDGSKNLNAALIRPHDAGSHPAANIDSHLPGTLCELLALRAREDSDRVAYRYLESDAEAPAVMSYGGLDTRAREIAAVLRSHNARGERAILLYPAGLDFITALFACLYEGVTAAPASLPRPGRGQAIENILQNSNAKFVLTVGRLREQLQKSIHPDAARNLQWICTDELRPAGAWSYEPLSPDAIAYLQYTSGSTSKPRGVMISHANVLANCADIARLCCPDRNSVTVSWLPHFHDMGLVFGIFESIYGGFPSILLSPARFLQRPRIWLDTIAEFHGTHSAAPNFAYELCVEKIGAGQRGSIDLTSWRFAACGAEPVREKTIERFADAFSASGFKRNVLCPAYGLAEATLLVSAVNPDQELSVQRLDPSALARNRAVETASAHANAVIGCGPASVSTRVAIVHPETGVECAVNEVGELWVSGPGVAQGYWNHPEKSRETFEARLAGDESARFLRTGDLGFRSGDELFITGRLKDLVIIRGRNHYPQDLEEAMQRSHRAIRTGAGAAFSMEVDAEERLVLMQEVERSQRRTDLDEVIAAIRQEIVENFAIAPYAIVLVKPGAMPKTSSGKVQRRLCRERFLRQEDLSELKSWTDTVKAVPAAASSHPEDSLTVWLITRVAESKNLDPNCVDRTQPFAYYGFDSRDAVAFTGVIAEKFGLELPATLLYDQPTIEALARHLSERLTARLLPDSGGSAEVHRSNEPLAIIGIGCRFPGAEGAEEFWSLLRDGRDAIAPLTKERRDLSGLNISLPGGFLDSVDLFDAAFFGISPREANRMDPQQRILLEVAWQAIEDAGLVRDSLKKARVGVFVGISNSDYGRILLTDAGSKDSYTATGAALSIAANRLSYAFDWIGPSISVDTACSSSLVAVHLASQSLRSGESDIALAGGVSLILSPAIYEDFSKSGMLAPDGRCKAFDSRADGYVRSEGAGVVVLKRLSQAIADGDSIYCVIRGSAVNQDGRSNGLMAPSHASQVALLRQAWKTAGIAPRDIQYIETHGTGTLLGDTIEASALAEAMGETDSHRWIGSVKSNIGHTESAAGIAGVIKTALAIYKDEIPASLHFKEPNPKISWETAPLRVAGRTARWREAKRIAGVSSFGFGGTNAHVVLEQAPAIAAAESVSSGVPQLLTLSARTPAALTALAHRSAEMLKAEPTPALADVCFTAANRRTHHACRLAVVADSCARAAELLVADANTVGNSQFIEGRKPVFVFSGQGAQRPGMGLELLSAEPAFRAAVEGCDAILTALGIPRAAELLATTQCAEFDAAQLGIFVLQIGLAALWRSWGIQPAAVVGHSVGEIAAANVAGALSLEDATRLVTLRSRLTKTVCGSGGMLSVSLPAEVIRATIRDFERSVTVAIENSPSSTVLSGDADALRAIEERLQADGIRSKPVKIGFASHGPAVELLRDDFLKGASAIKPRAASIPFYSAVCGAALAGEELDAAYWWKNLRDPVRFSTSIASLANAQFDCFLELSAHPILAAPIIESMPQGKEAIVLASLRNTKGERASMLGSLGSLYCSGASVNWQALFPDKGRHLRFPIYPFDRKRYWTESPAASTQGTVRASGVVAPVNGHSAGRTEVREQLISLLANLLQQNPSDIHFDAPFLEMGADSIVMVNAVRQIRNRFGVDLSIRQLFETERTINALAAYVEREAAPSAAALSSVDPHPKTAETPAAGALERIFTEQLNTVSRLIAEQLQVLRGASGEQGTEPATIPSSRGQREVYVPYKPIQPGEVNVRSVESHPAKALIQRYTAKTATSRRITQQYRRSLADNRASAGFRFSIKDMLYPVHSGRSSGSKIFDVDGNEYIDLTMGFGANLFGHNPPFVVEAIERQLKDGIQLGPQSPLAGEVAELISGFTGMERVTFCNSGTEAVMTAVRLARAATGRKKIALFAGSYHGTFDGILAQADDVPPNALPLAPGVLPGAVHDLLVLNYGDPHSLDLIRRHAGDLAAVVVEPVQSRRPDLQPKEFLHALRELTRDRDVALIFDEVITGFRIAPGGAQEWFGVRADLATYGKVIGGGMPVGVVAGSPDYMDGIDGGFWSYGDDSYPRAKTTFFAGTFCKHPLTMAAAKAVLLHMQSQGPELQSTLNRRTVELASTLNDTFTADGAPIRVVNFGSLFRFAFSGNLDLFFYHLLEKGIYIWEGRNCFLSTAHSEEDLDRIVRHVREATHELQEAGVVKRATTVAAYAAKRFELNDAQKHMWALVQMDPHAASAYTLSSALELRGPLRRQELQKAFETVVARHDALRVSISPDGQEAHISASVTMELLVEDGTQWPESDRAKKLQQWLDRETNWTFDLSSRPLFRIGLLRLEQDRHILVFGIHHIISDGLSLAVLLDEVMQAYDALCRGASPDLKPAMQFSEYINLQRRTIGSDRWRADEAFWSKQFEKPAPVVDVPGDRPRPAVRTFRGARSSITAGTQLATRIRQFARAQSATPFMVLYAAWMILVHRLSGQEDVVIGFPSAGRSFDGSERVVGYCANVLPVRCQVAAGMTAEAVVGQIRSVLLEALEHGDYPLTELVRRLNPRREPGRSPLFDIAFNFDRAAETPKMCNLDVKVLPSPVHTSKFDLTLNVIESAHDLTFELEYNSDLYDSETAKRLLSAMTTLVQDLCERPSARLSELALMAPAEAREMLFDWNRTDRPQAETTVVQLLEEQARRAPEATAVAFQDRRLSYGELNARANQLAYYLREMGVGAEQVIGVCMDRSPEMIVSLAGILKTGAAYLPLDPDYPSERRAYMLQDAGVQLLLTADSDWERIAGFSSADLDAVIRPEQLAYVIYTSGSTGRPKGVMLTHGGLANLVAEQTEMFQLGPGVRTLQVASLSFDAAVSEIWSALASGSELHLGSREEMRPGQDLADVLAQRGIEVVTITPTALSVINELASLRTLVVAGEACSAELAEKWRVGRRMVNAYGPTETTVCATMGEIRDAGKPGIGGPMGNVRVYVLDAHGEPAPVGVAGELYIGGAGVGRGYLGRPDLTAERFVPDEWSGQTGARLYRTGDQVRWRADGTLEYLGRLDEQVKIRGMRIELGEIEAVLKRQAGVGDAVVIAREEDGERRLAAYVTAAAGAAAPNIGELRQKARASLPEHMIPAAWMVLDQLPLTPSGKLDRKALPAPSMERPDLGRQYEAPATDVERQLGEIWKELLRLNQVGVHDNFFAVGGDSILAIQVIGRARQHGLRLQPHQIFQFQTIRELAAHVEISGRTQAEQGLVEGETILAPIQRWFFEQNFSRPGHWNQSVVLKVNRTVTPETCEEALEVVLRQHDALRSVFWKDSNGSWHQLIQGAQAARIPLKRIDAHGLAEAELRERVAGEGSGAHSEFDLGHGPLVRAAWFDRDAGQEAWLLIVAHHLVVDGVSWRILLEDLETAIRQLERGEEVRLGEKTSSYRQWTDALVEIAASGKLDSERDFWLEQVEEPAPCIPVDSSDGANDIASEDRVTIQLDESDTRRLLHDLPSLSKAQPHEVLLTALLTAWNRWSGQSRLRVQVEAHGRDQRAALLDTDISRTVGWFTAAFPVVFEWREGSPIEALKAIKEQWRRVPAKGVGYGILRYLGEDEQLRKRLAANEPEIGFNYLGQVDAGVAHNARLELTREWAGPDSSGAARRTHVFEILAEIAGGRLRVDWVYSRNRRQRSTVEQLAAMMNDGLRELLQFSSRDRSVALTPSDFSGANLTQGKVEKVLRMVSGKRGA